MEGGGRLIMSHYFAFDAFTIMILTWSITTLIIYYSDAQQPTQ